MGSLINLLKYGKLRSAMYGQRSGGGCACAILAMCSEWWGVVFDGVVPTNNELVKVAPNKESIDGDCLLCLNGDAGRGLIPLTIGERNYNHRERR